VIEFQYVHDSDVDATLDDRLRALLCRCFRKPEDAVFQRRRYFQQMPPHRFFWFGESGEVCGHIAVHDKPVGFGETLLVVGGIAEVCVHPEQRGQGAVRDGLGQVHDWLRGRGVGVALLFGELEIYRSSGYEPIDAPVRFLDPTSDTWREQVMTWALAARLDGRDLPPGRVDLGGPVW
jgi:predicted acetyltransferase